MRILYGVVGEGMGHATRSRVVLEHVLSQGHEVQVVVSGTSGGLGEGSVSWATAGLALPIRRRAVRKEIKVRVMV